jgi:hypothetical protein
MPVTIPPSTPLNAVTDLGFVPDGVTDNFPAFVRAVASVSAIPDVRIFFPPHPLGYNFIVPYGSPIVLPAGMAIYGLPGTGTTLYIDPSSFVGLTSGQQLVFIKYNTGCSICGLVFDSQRSKVNGGAATPYAMSFVEYASQTASNNVFRDLIFQNQVGSYSTETFCIASGHQSTGQLYDNVLCQNGYGTGISLNGDMAVELANPGTGLVSQCIVINCAGINMAWQGVTFYGARKCRLVNYYGANCGSSGVGLGAGANFEWTDDIDVDGCMVENNYGGGISGFGWNGEIRFTNLVSRNNNTANSSSIAEISFSRGSWYTSSFTPASSRTIIEGVVQKLYFFNPRVTPNPANAYPMHLRLAADPYVSYPTQTASQPTLVVLDSDDAPSWRMTCQPANPYAYSININGASWQPASAITVNSTRNNGGYLFTCTTAGTTAAVGSVGPTATATGQSVNDGSVVWTSTSVLADQNQPGASWAQATAYTLNDVRTNNGYAYRFVAPTTGTATSGTAGGPHGTTLNGTETDGGITWECLGVFETSTIISGSYVPKLADSWLTGIQIGSLQVNLPSAATQPPLWTATSCTVAGYTGGGDISGNAVLLTNTAAASAASASVGIIDTKYILPGAYVARIRYSCPTGDPNWHFCTRPVGAYNSSTGADQFDVQLSPVIGDTAGWYEAQVPFIVPPTSLAQAHIYWSGEKVGGQIVIDSVSVVPLTQTTNYQNAQIILGGHKLYEGTTPTNMDFDVGDRWLSTSNFGNDQLCAAAGSYATLGAATASMTSGAKSGTLSAADPTWRPGLWVSIAGAGAGGAALVTRLLYVSGTSFTTSNSCGTTVSGAAVTVAAPTFVLSSASVPLPAANPGVVAHAGGGYASATQLVYGINLVQTVATAGDSVKLPTAVPGEMCVLTNAGSNSLNYFAFSLTEFVNGLNGTNPVALSSTPSTKTFYCARTGYWYG